MNLASSEWQHVQGGHRRCRTSVHSESPLALHARLMLQLCSSQKSLIVCLFVFSNELGQIHYFVS